MFDNPDFYPTPEPVIKQMLEPWLGKQKMGQYDSSRPILVGMTILEPSAGRGNILDWMKRHIEHVEGGSYGHDKSKQMYACESDPELKALLQGKHYKVIADDFLAYHGDHQFDLVVMNPPFSHGDEHMIHAYKTVAPGGHVVALINSESIWNAYSETRQLLAQLIEDHGSVEHLGQVFKQAERKTSVEVALIRLQKPADNDPLLFEFKRGNREGHPELSEENMQNAVALNDAIGNMMVGYAKVKEAFVGYVRARKALDFYSKGLIHSYESIDKLADEAMKDGNGNLRASYNSFSDVLKQQAWREVMGKLGIEKYMTAKIRQDFATYGKQQGYMDFTKENVAALVEMVFENRTSILEQAVVAVFDEFTKYHKENRCHVEGWKTNDKFKVNRRIVMPYFCERKWDGKFSRRISQGWEKYSDIDKVMCYLTGTDYNKLGKYGTIDGAIEYGTNIGNHVYTVESAFFEIKCYQKGTGHLKFLDERLWQEFNLRACAGKLWLPEPEMKEYQQRSHSPFEKPKPQPAPSVAIEPKAMLQLAERVLAEPILNTDTNQFALF